MQRNLLLSFLVNDKLLLLLDEWLHELLVSEELTSLGGVFDTSPSPIKMKWMFLRGIA